MAASFSRGFKDLNTFEDFRVQINMLVGDIDKDVVRRFSDNFFGPAGVSTHNIHHMLLKTETWNNYWRAVSPPVYRKTDIDTAECSNALLLRDAMLDPLHTSSPCPPIPHWEGDGGDMVLPSTEELELAQVDPRLVVVFSDPARNI